MGRQPRAKPDLSLLEGVKAYAPVDFGRLRQRIQIEQMETPSNPPEWTYTTGFTAQEAANALVRAFGGQSSNERAHKIVEAEREVERMEATGLAPSEMYEEPLVVPSEMLVEYDYDLTRWAEWMRKDALGCPFYRPEERHNG